MTAGGRKDACGGVFEKAWSDEEAAAERDGLFPDVPQEDCGIVCDDCFQKMSAHYGWTDSTPAPASPPEGEARKG